MDASLLKLLADAGTVAILIYLLIQILGAYKVTVNRVTDLLEREISDDGQDGAKAA